MLDQITQGINTESPDDPAHPLGTLQSGASLLAKALQSFPELADAASMVATIGGEENGEQPGQTDQQGGKAYNGTIDMMGHPVEIKDGIGDADGNPIYVSPNGEVVADDKGTILGRVENGKFSIIDKAYGEKLEQSKMAERSK